MATILKLTCVTATFNCVKAGNRQPWVDGDAAIVAIVPLAKIAKTSRCLVFNPMAQGIPK